MQYIFQVSSPATWLSLCNEQSHLQTDTKSSKACRALFLEGSGRNSNAAAAKAELPGVQPYGRFQKQQLELPCCMVGCKCKTDLSSK
eukprot:scaffold85665_cov40-Prasinocladus_malaysianus.AAC.1